MSQWAAADRGRSESSSRAGRILQALGGVLVLSSILVGVFATHVSAAGLSNATVTLKISSSGAAATNPLSSHQLIDISISPNSTLSRASLEAAGFPSGAVPIKVLQCSDIGGQQANLPTKPAQCEPETVDAVAAAQENGALDVKKFTVFALPDPELGVSNGTVCDDAEHQCVLGIFSNQNDFSKPHLFSAPFQVVSTGASNGTGSTNASGASNAGGTSSSGAATGGASAQVSVPPATLANTGGPTLWPWLFGSGCVMLLGGSALRLSRRRAQRGA